VAQDRARMDYSMSKDMNSQPATNPMNSPFEMEEEVWSAKVQKMTENSLKI
jgi:hypothetical protein